MLSATQCDHIPNVTFNKDYKVKITVHCYLAVNVINFGLAHGDHIMRLLL